MATPAPVRATSALAVLLAVATTIITTTALPVAADTATRPQPVAAQDLKRTGRIQALGPTGRPNDIHDGGIRSPKSAAFSPDGRKLYINALEGSQTLVYAYPSLKRLATITHAFDAGDAALFMGETTVFGYPYFNGREGSRNVFTGKPVEMAFSHGGRYLWVPYYRRSYDPNASSPSAMAVIDTRSDRIVRVLPTGPLPKFIAVSPDSTLAVVTHWGDNTLGVLDIRGDDPAGFRYIGHWTVEYRMPVEGLEGDRDSQCGFCLRGTVFTPDGKTVLVARMGGGGLAGFEAASGRYLGTLLDFVPNPRHLAISPDGRTLYASGNQSGAVGRYDLAAMLAALAGAGGKRIDGPGGQTLAVGRGARTIALSPDGRTLYAAINNESRLVKVDLARWQVVDRAAVDPFTVGLAVSPDGRTIVTTSQGRSGQGGGNSVGLYTDTAVD
jgi:DNA-binding beta-propeller fold protein YncE